jgi:hypothetical protein
VTLKERMVTNACYAVAHPDRFDCILV